MFTLFIRAIILYVVMLLAMRGLGKRQLGQFQPYEFTMTIIMADLISSPMESISTPLLYGLLPVAALFSVHSIITLLSMRSDKIRAIVSGRPAVVISKGVINQRELDRLCLSLSDLLEGLRGKGILNPADAGTAVIEANGSLSAFPNAKKRPPTAMELDIDAGYEGQPLALIMDGKLQHSNLAQAGQSTDWLNDLLSARGLTIKGVYFMSLDTQGMMTLQPMRGGTEYFLAVKPSEVCW